MKDNSKIAWRYCLEVSNGNFCINGRKPLEEIRTMIQSVSNYLPFDEERLVIRNWVMDRLGQIERDLILGGLKV